MVDRFYSALKAIYGSKFDQQFTSLEDVQESKSMWGGDIAAKNDNQLMGCISNAKARLRAGDKNWLWPNMGLVLSFIDGSWQQARQSISCHEVMNAPIIDKGEGRNRIAAPVDRSKAPEDWLAEMKGLFNE